MTDILMFRLGERDTQRTASVHDEIREKGTSWAADEIARLRLLEGPPSYRDVESDPQTLRSYVFYKLRTSMAMQRLVDLLREKNLSADEIVDHVIHSAGARGL
ncbi:hypothetical protein [Aureimonas sp. AU40]|uniref:hypothetical protein n=1 Tax=Aureimonas sp. AU40 TaxID=1637747 RepID=UPI0007848600|nr:hypothetical protein [Aureimonas sp. AU40]